MSPRKKEYDLPLDLNKKRKVTPEKAVKILKAHGTNVTIEEAKVMLDLMYKFARIQVEKETGNHN